MDLYCDPNSSSSRYFSYRELWLAAIAYCDCSIIGNYADINKHNEEPNKNNV